MEGRGEGSVCVPGNRSVPLRRVYVEHAGVGALPADAVTTELSEDGLTAALTIVADGKAHRLKLSESPMHARYRCRCRCRHMTPPCVPCACGAAPLHDRVTAIRARAKGDRVTLTLTKGDEIATTWWELVRGAKGGVDVGADE